MLFKYDNKLEKKKREQDSHDVISPFFKTIHVIFDQVSHVVMSEE